MVAQGTRGIIAIVLLCAAGVAEAAAVSAEPTLNGYARIHLQRGPQNHLILRGAINGSPASFLIDTGTTISFLRADRVRQFGAREIGEFGRGAGRAFPLATLARLDVGSTSLGPVTVGLLTPGHLRGTLPGGGTADGVIGLELLALHKSVINCRTRQLFIKTNAAAGLNLDDMTRGLGFVKIGLDVGRTGDLRVPCTLHGRAGRMIVDTGAFVTGFDDDAVRRLALKRHPSKLQKRGLDGEIKLMELAQVDDLTIGGVSIAPQLFAITDLFGKKRDTRAFTGMGRIEYYAPRDPDAQVLGVLGNELLDARRAIIDLENNNLFLK